MSGTERQTIGNVTVNKRRNNAPGDGVCKDNQIGWMVGKVGKGKGRRQE